MTCGDGPETVAADRKTGPTRAADAATGLVAEQPGDRTGVV